MDAFWSMPILSLFPPIIVLILGVWTRNVILSLVIGVLAGSYIATNGALIPGVIFFHQTLRNNLEIDTFFNASTFWQSWNPFICIFLLLLGIFITCVEKGGGTASFKRMMLKRIKTKKQLEYSSLLLSSCLCIDDYFSSLTAGSLIGSLVDFYKVSRAKLAFLIDAMAAPLTILCPVSSWVAAIVGFLRDNGISSMKSSQQKVVIDVPSFEAYINIIPYIFYSFVVLLGTWFLVHKQYSFGSMARYEEKDAKNRVQDKELDEESADEIDNGLEFSLLSFILPILILVLSVVISLIKSGGYNFFSEGTTLSHALQNAHAAPALFIGGCVALAFTLIYYLSTKRLKFKMIPQIAKAGISLMYLPCIVLLLAWSMGDILRNNLNTGEYIAQIVKGHISFMYLPCIVFLFSAMISCAIGSSWGTAAIVFPIAVQIVSSGYQDLATSQEQLTLLYPLLGAVLSGCVAGDHISPISDTTIMSAASSKIPHMDHVMTQLSYAIPFIGISAVLFLLIGLQAEYLGRVALLQIYIAMPLLISLVFVVLNKFSKKLAAK